MKRLVGLTMVILMFSAPVPGQQKKSEFDAERAWTLIRDLSDDAMQGRESGQPGAVMAEDYIGGKFREWGLEPAGDDGTYFQTFTIEHRHIAEGASLDIIDGGSRRNLYYGDDWRVQRYSGSGRFTAEIVFVGYGISAPEAGYDDYAGVDVKDKVVLFSTGVPSRLENSLGEAGGMDARILAARKRGARGAMVFRPAGDPGRYFRLQVSKAIYDPHFVLISVEDRITDHVFKELPTDLRYLFQKIGTDGEPESFATGVQVELTVHAEFDPERKTRNILAKITGSDPDLKHEAVVIGGHMDHLGISPSGDVMNGANDNASGTAVAMEIARIMKTNRVRSKRTVIFAAWAGEEQGLLGSYHFADHPTHPIDQIVAYINMDMVAHGSGEVNFRGEYYAPQIWEIIKANLPREILEYVTPGRGGPGGSDHTPFLMKGVPAYGAGSQGYHFKYHRNRDDIDLVKPEVLKRVGDLVYAAVLILANETGDFILPQRQAMFYFKNQNLINFKTNLLEKVVDHRKDDLNSDVDGQLSLVSGENGLSGDALRLNIIDTVLTAGRKARESRGLVVYSNADKLNSDVRSGKTVLIPGLKGFDAFRDKPEWARALASQDLFYVLVDGPSDLFAGDELSEDGITLLKAANQAGLLVMIKGANEIQAQNLLAASQKPVVLVTSSVPEGALLTAIKDKQAVLGLSLSGEMDPGIYARIVVDAVERLGSNRLALVNQNCLRKEQGMKQMLAVIENLLEMGIERSAWDDLFGGAFLKALDANRTMP